MNRLHFSVMGINNNQSKTSVKNSLDKVEGVQMVNVDIARGTVEVGYNEPADETLIRQGIEKGGFKILS